MKKTHIIAGTLVLVTAGIIGAATLAPVYAQEDTSSKTLLQTIVEKFNLNKDEVQKVVSSYKDENQAERTKNLTERLDFLVYKKEITEEQKNKILAKHQELSDRMDTFWTLSKDEKKTKMNELRSELEDWAKANGIDTKYVFMFGGMGRFEGRGFGKGEMEGFDL